MITARKIKLKKGKYKFRDKQNKLHKYKDKREAETMYDKVFKSYETK